MSRISRSPSRPASGSPAYSPDDRPQYRGGSGGSVPVWTPDELFGVGDFGDWIDWRDADHLFTDTAGTTNVAAAGDLIARANGRRGNVVMSQSTSGNRGKWALADGISSELVSGVVMSQTFTARSYPSVLTVAHVMRRANLSGSGDTSDFRVNVPATNGTRAGYASNNNRNGGTYTTTADTIFILYSQEAKSGSGLFRRVQGGVVDVTQTVAPGTATEYSQVLLDQRRSLGRFAYSTLSLFIERELTNDELILLAAYAGA
jgi:hypothetical protein